MKDEIQRIISGKSEIKHGYDIQTVLSFLTGSQGSGSMVKTDKRFKKECKFNRFKCFSDIMKTEELCIFVLCE